MAKAPQLLGYTALLGNTAPEPPSRWDRVKQALWETNLNAPIRGFYNLMNTPDYVLAGKGTPEEFDAAVGNSFDAAAGMATMGSVVPRPSNSLGMFGKPSNNRAVTETGDPLTVYHGSNQKLTSIEPDVRDPGAWFTTEINNAANYARGDQGHVHKAHLQAENPLIVEFLDDEYGNPIIKTNDPEIDGMELDDNVSLVKAARNRGYDSVNFPNGNFTEQGNTWVVFNKNQIRLLGD